MSAHGAEEHLVVEATSRSCAASAIRSRGTVSRRSLMTDGQALATTLRQIADGAAPVTLVVHEDDASGGWQFLWLDDWVKGDLILVHPSHPLAGDPSLAQVRGLPRGRYASRANQQAARTYGDVSEIETD
jgi:hypothetical protein